MPLPRFSEALVERRRELGLSIAQASRTLKLREDVLVAFEEGDYDHMPQSGYAQGMLSSYARYLGLNAREIVDLFQEEVYEYRHGTSSHELRRRTRQTQSGRGISGYDMPNEAGSRPKAYVEYRPLLPSGGGPAGDMGDFATTAMARPRASVPLAGSSLSSTPYGYARDAGAPSGAPSPAGGGYAAGRGPSRPTAEGRGSSHPYNTPSTRERSSASTARHRPPSSRRRGDDKAGRLINERQHRPGAHDGRGGYLRDDVSTRRVRRGEYTDDLRLDDRPRPSVPASTVSGRRSSRNIASVERPNVRRRSSRAGSVPPSRKPPRRGIVGWFSSDPRRTLFLIIVLLAIVLTTILTFSVSSCVSGRSQPSEPSQVVPVEDVNKDDEANGGGDGDADAADDQPGDGDPESDPQEGDDVPGEQGDSEDETPAEGEKDPESEGSDEPEEPKEPEETVVDVSVASGSVSWIEITCDGVSEVADSVTGPWRQSYTVYDSITVQVASPDVVTVTENGKVVDFSRRAGGLGSVTIEGTPAPEPQESDEQPADAEAAEQ